MGNYLSAECYKAVHRKYIYIFSAAMLGLVAAFMLLLRIEGMSQSGDGMLMVQRVSVSELLGILAMALSAGLYFLMIAADIVFSDQYKYNTLKNEVSYGLPRWQIYLGKLTASALTAGILCLVLMGGYIGIGCVLFPAGEDFGTNLATFAKWLLIALPLWLGGLGFFNMLQFLIKGSNAAVALRTSCNHIPQYALYFAENAKSGKCHGLCLGFGDGMADSVHHHRGNQFSKEGDQLKC